MFLRTRAKVALKSQTRRLGELLLTTGIMHVKRQLSCFDYKNNKFYC